MKKYECLYIVNINFDSEGTSAVVARVEEVLKNVGGELVNTQHWGKRKLAYAIDKERYGNYVLMHFQGENPDISELAREFEIESGVLHYMTIRLDEFPDFDTLAVPQAYEADRGRRPGGRDGGRDGRDGRRPRREEHEAAPAEEVAEDAEVVEEPAAEEAAPETVEETPAETADDEKAEEVVEEAAKEESTEEVAEEAEVKDEPAAPEVEVEESADETPEEVADSATEEEADKPADAE